PRALHAAARQPRSRQGQRLRDADLHLRARRDFQGAGGVGQGGARPREALAAGHLRQHGARRAEQVDPRVGLQGPQRALAHPRGVAQGRPVAPAARRPPDQAGEQGPGPRGLLAAGIAESFKGSGREGGPSMKVSFFETVRYLAPEPLRPEWPVPSGAYDREAGAQAYGGMIERLQLVEELGFDWVSVSEHHYSPRILTPNPIVAAAFIAAHVKKLKIALLGPIVPQSNPVRVAEELAMLDTLSQGRLVAGLLRGTTNEYLTYDLNPKEARERTDEGMELIL